MQTSCGWSLQPAPALALALLQADIDARHREVVCALVWLNKVPARQAASQECPRMSPKATSSMMKPLQGRATASRDPASTDPKVALAKQGEILEPGHTEHTAGPFPGRTLLHMHLSAEHPTQSAHRLL